MLLHSSPLYALEKFAFVNEYSVDIDAANPTYLRQLVIVIIKHGNHFIYTFIGNVLQPVGHVILNSIDADTTNY